MNPAPDDVRRHTLQYLRVAPGAPWRWEEDGRVLVWSDGGTLAFREEINAVIERLALRGLPSFAEVAVLIAACRLRMPAPPAEPASGAGQGDFLYTLALRNHDRIRSEFVKVGALPPQLLQSAPAKAALIAALLEGRISRRGPEAEAVRLGQTLLFAVAELNTPAPEIKPLDLEAAHAAVAECLRGHTVESLGRLVRTGLAALPVAAPEVVLPAATGVRRLLGQLARDEFFSGLVAATRDLMAAIRLPTAIVAVEELALGGASGLGNRGPLDRLLLSELAHDDLTLAARVALNEALYLQREPPVLKPEQALVILLDSGLRLWGVPRLVAASATLALVAGHRGTGAVSVWRPEGEKLAPVDVLSRVGLEKHLEVLRPELDARAALPALDEQLDPAGDVDVVFVTHRAALQDADFAGALARARGRRHFVLTVDQTGGVALHTLPWGSARPLAQTQTDPNRLQAAPRPEVRPPSPVLASVVDRDRPAIFRMRSFPLLLPVLGRIDEQIAVGDGGLAVTGDRRLLAWENRQRGARQVLTGLPGGNVVALHRDKEGRIIVIKHTGAEQQMSVTIVRPNEDEPLVARMGGRRKPQAVHCDGDVLLVLLSTRLAAISLETGSVLEEHSYPPGHQWKGGRYFVSDETLRYVYWNGSCVQWDEVFGGRNRQREGVVLAFERDGVGAWVVQRNGWIIAPTGIKLMEIGFPVLTATPFAGGNLLLVADQGGRHYQVSLQRRTVHSVHRYKSAEAFARTLVFPPMQPLQARFSAICAAPGQPVRLRKRTGGWLEIADLRGSLRLASTSSDTRVHEKEKRDFSEPVGAPGCGLRLVTWADGSRAWLDSRGLLHFRSSDPAVAELTLTLNQGWMAAWDSHGGVQGPAFFTGQEDRQEVPRAVEILMEFSARLC